MNISVIGCGRWGCFLAWYANRMGHRVLLYGRESSDKYQQLKATRSNDSLRLEQNVQLCSDIHQTLMHASVVLISIDAQNLRALMASLPQQSLNNKTLVLCMKGIEVDTGERLTQIVDAYLPQGSQSAIWVGPGHVQIFLAGIPNCMVIDSKDEDSKKTLVQALSSDLIRFYYGNDLIGNEIGAAAKNVIGIAAGMLDGLNKTSLKGALMSRGTREIGRLIDRLGGNERSAYGLAHLGDYEATVFSQYSHNRAFGENFVRKQPYGLLAEGVPTTKALLHISERYGVELPICQAVHSVIFDEQEPERVLSELFLRDLKQELM